MMSCRHVLPVLTLALLAGLGGTARGAEADPALARAQIRETSEKVLEIFRTRELFAPEASDRLLAELRAVLDQRFDWPTMARWVLGRKRPLFDESPTCSASMSSSTTSLRSNSRLSLATPIRSTRSASTTAMAPARPTAASPWR